MSHELPVMPAVVRPPQLTALGLLPVPRDPVACFDQRVHATRIRPGETDIDFSDGQERQAVSLELGPAVAAVSRHMDATPRTPTLTSPCMDLNLPHPREENPRIVGIHFQARRASVFIHEQHVLPRLAAVHRAEDSTLTLRTVTVTQRSHVHDVGVSRVDDDARCAARPR